MAAMATSIRDLLRVEPGMAFSPDSLDPASTPGVSKKRARADLDRDRTKLYDLQARLYAERARGVLLVLQGMDTSGKDGTIIHVIGGLNPEGVSITSFKKPTPEELSHSFLWRIRRALPAAGQVGIFNRSHYEDVIVVRVHRLVPRSEWAGRYEEINAFEREVDASGTRLVKAFLHISPEAQRERLLARLEDPTKRWKFNTGDLKERARWKDYQRAYGDAVTRCSTPEAPWYAIPADHKWYRNWAVTRLLIETLREMDPQYPQPAIDVAAFEAELRADAGPT
jgi:PPK2 family polyphosphate:nucleotide phosphotransferase